MFRIEKPHFQYHTWIPLSHIQITIIDFRVHPRKSTENCVEENKYLMESFDPRPQSQKRSSSAGWVGGGGEGASQERALTIAW